MVPRLFRRRTPFDFSRGVSPPGRYPPDRLSPDQAAETIRHSPIEIGYGFDTHERQAFRQVGNADLIMDLSERDLRAIRLGTFVHNHPPYHQFPASDARHRAGSFSPTDLTFVYEHHIDELIPVTADRTYALRQLPGGPFLDPGEIAGEYLRFLNSVRDRLLLEACAGRIAPEEATANGRLADEVMERMAAYYDYRWEEVR
jgi:hypothetical protein